MTGMRTSDFEYDLPKELIAQRAIEPRDSSRLMVLHRHSGRIEHRVFSDLPEYLEAGDLVVCNDSRVIPARLTGRKVDGEAKIELLLLRRLEPGVWESLARPGRRLKAGTLIALGPGEEFEARIVSKGEGGVVVVELSDEDALLQAGAVPLPPYIHRAVEDPERYQTVYSRCQGSVAAPTAGLHFTPELMERISGKGVGFGFITLHLSLDSFRPVSADDPTRHAIHREYGGLDSGLAIRIEATRARGGRVVCVGTSSVRMLEHTASRNGRVASFDGWTDLFILPGHEFRVVDAMITNFHLPRSTLLMLVSAFAGTDLIRKAYGEAVQQRYRFYSFGDAMLIL